MTRLDRQTGLSLVELMVAITIGLFLLAGAVTIFTNSKRTYTETDDSSRMQESLRFAMDMVTRDLRAAGFFGCAYGINPDNLSSSLATANTLLNIRRGPLEAVDGASDEIILRHAGGPRWRVTGDSSGSNVAVENTDSRVCVKADGTAATSCDATDALVFGGNGTKLTPGIVAVSSCGAGDVFVASAATDTALTAAAPLPAAYNKGPSGEPDALVSAVTLVRYFVSSTTDTNGDGTVEDNEIGLYREDPLPDGSGTATTLVMPGVENLQITYAIDDNDNGEIDVVVDAPTKDQWPHVVGVKVGMVARSLAANALEGGAPAQCLNGRKLKLTGGVLVDDGANDATTCAATAPTDNRRRRSMETSVALRARLVASNFKDLP